VVVSHYSTAREQFAYCPRCYDPSEGTADTERVCGHGATVDEALWSWAEQHETVHEVEWVPNTLWRELEEQLATEAARQRRLGHGIAWNGCESAALH
jgi:hypothetical protein